MREKYPHKKMQIVKDKCPSNDIENVRLGLREEDSISKMGVDEQEVLVSTFDRSQLDTSDEKEEDGACPHSGALEGEPGCFCEPMSRSRRTAPICISIFLCIILVVTLTFIVGNSNSKGITASMRGHGSFSRNTCEDYDYGCCEIYHQCNVITTNEQQHMDYKKINLDVYVIHAEDTIKSNCVSLRDIVSTYNTRYGRDDCGPFGCCPDIDIGCDEAIHYHINDGYKSVMETYLQNRTLMIPIKVPKNNTEGTNCWTHASKPFWSRPGITHFTWAYNHDFPIPDDSTSFAPLVILVIGIWCLGCTKFK